MLKIFLSFALTLSILLGFPSIAQAQSTPIAPLVKQETTPTTCEEWQKLEGEVPDFGPLKDLIGTWVGKGWNLIAIPSNKKGQFDVEINPYIETLTFTPVNGLVANKGFPENQCVAALLYEQKVKDSDTQQPIHIENGMWLLLNKQPSENKLPLARQSSVPHGNSLLALGDFVNIDGAPSIPDLSSLPIFVNPTKVLGYSEGKYLPHVREFIPGNANQVLQDIIQNQNILNTSVLKVSTENSGGIANIPFIKKNADATSFESTFWIEKVQNEKTGNVFLQLQYSQQANLKFIKDFTTKDPNALIIWPHVDVSTLVKQ